MQRASDSSDVWQDRFLWSFSILMMAAVGSLFIGGLALSLREFPIAAFLTMGIFSIIVVGAILATFACGLGWAAAKLKKQ